MKTVDTTECFWWDGNLTAHGYPVLGDAMRARLGTASLARFVFQEDGGVIPPGMEIDHLCNNRACINPEHLDPVTHAENRRRSAERKVSCARGHPFNAGTTYMSAGHRTCRECRSVRSNK